MRFAKPLTVALTAAALMALPLSGAAFAAAPAPESTASLATGKPTVLKTPQPARSHPTETKIVREKEIDRKDDARKRVSLTVSVDPSHVRAGGSYGVTIVAKGVSSGTATITSPEGKSYRVALSGGRATKTLTVPSNAKSGNKTVTVKVGNKVATDSFTVVGGRDQRDDRRHDGK
ncbi:hypothetical protein ACTMTI_54775 [Nonomuraea sp. H19]|uniref:hypothetical protein n=1 Tax=Nonomuraea sp. H19 TaxID=3452206 RepID=UPI003F899DBB